MIIETALEAAIEYETKVRDVYTQAAARSADERGRRIFSVLAEEERGHVEYLEHRLEQWVREKKLTAEDLKTAVSHARLRARPAERVREMLAPEVTEQELALLRQALTAEIETSEYYRRLVAELPAEGRAFFARFLEIEEGHMNLVLYEIDSLTKSGFWMGFQEFDMEAID